MTRLILGAMFLTIGLWGSGSPSAFAADGGDAARVKEAFERIGEGTPAEPQDYRSPAHRGTFNVMEFGAKGDGVTDDTAAFQKALDVAYSDGGGTVNVPSGIFLIKTHLIIPSNVTLEGVWRKPQWGDYVKKANEKPVLSGTTLLAVEGKGDANGTPFITLNGKPTSYPKDDRSFFKGNATLSGVTIYYPEQINADPPHAYPWTIRGDGNDCGVLNVTIINTYQAVDFGTNSCGRHYVDGLYAYPFKTGLYVNACFDVGRLNNIHFWPFIDPFNDKSPLRKYTRANGTGFLFGRTDGELVSNCFSIFYNTGIHLIGGPIPENKEKEPLRLEYQGGCAAFTNMYVDVSNCAVKVDDSMENSGYSFVNCFFMSKIVVGPRNRGPIRFTGCAFWATSDLDSHAKLEGVAPVLFEGCHFVNWDRDNKGAPCIDANASEVVITGNEFMSFRPNHHKVTLGPNVREAVVTSNIMSGGVSITNNAPKFADVQIGLNAGNKVEAYIRRWTIIGPFPNPDITPTPQGDAPTRAGYDTDYLTALGGEANVVLKPGAKVEYTDDKGAKQTVTAAAVPTNDAARLDFARRLKSNHLVGYAYTEFETKKAEDIQVFFGSGDSAKVWANGELVHSIWTPGREFAPGQDTFTFRAQKGLNRILVKVENGPTKYWEFMMEARDKKGNALNLRNPWRD